MKYHIEVYRKDMRQHRLRQRSASSRSGRWRTLLLRLELDSNKHMVDGEEIGQKLEAVIVDDLQSTDEGAREGLG